MPFHHQCCGHVMSRNVPHVFACVMRLIVPFLRSTLDAAGTNRSVSTMFNIILQYPRFAVSTA